MKRFLMFLAAVVVGVVSLAPGQPNDPGDGGGGPPAHPIVTVSTTTGSCGSPNVSWEAVTGATEYELVRNDVVICTNAQTTCGITRTVPGRTEALKVRGKVNGVWQPFGPTNNFTFTCTSWTTRPTGELEFLSAMFKFPDATSEPITLAQLEEIVYTDVNDRIDHDSYGTTSITGPAAQGYYTMPHDIDHYCIPVCDPLPLNDDANAILTGESGYDFVVKGYTDVIGAWSYGVFGTGALGYVQKPHVIMHEWGHREGLLHVGSWNCGTYGSETGESFANATQGSCFAGRYSGPGYMGASDIPYTALQRQLLGWQPSDDALTLSYCGSGTYTVKALEGSTGPREIRIPFASYPGWFYSLEYRDDGVWVWLHQGYSTGVTGWSSDTELYIVNKGLPVTATDTFTDSFRGITVTMTDSDSASATLSIVRPGC